MFDQIKTMIEHIKHILINIIWSACLFLVDNDETTIVITGIDCPSIL